MGQHVAAAGVQLHCHSAAAAVHASHSINPRGHMSSGRAREGVPSAVVKVHKRLLPL